MDHWAKISSIVGIPAFLVALWQFLGAGLPTHAMVPALIIGVLLMIQGCIPWRHRSWSEDSLSDLKHLMQRINIIIFSSLFLVAISILGAAYIWENAPEWIEGGLNRAAQDNRITPVPAAAQATPSGSAKLPEIAVAIASPSRSRSPSPPSSVSPPPRSFSLYVAKTALSVAIGTTSRFSELALLGIVVQVLFIIVMALIERIAEARPGA